MIYGLGDIILCSSGGEGVGGVGVITGTYNSEISPAIGVIPKTRTCEISLCL